MTGHGDGMLIPPLIPTTVVGSHPQPRWLIDHERLIGEGVPRVRAEDIWSVAPEHLDEAIEAATLVAIADQTEAGIDIITDGEVGRESYFNHFANSLGGVDPDEIGRGVNRRGGVAEVPLVNGPIVRTEPVELDAARFLLANTDRRTKVTVPGPFTLSQLADNRYYADQKALAFAYADAVNAELKDLVGAGVDVVQLDEPYLQANAEVARGFAVDAIAAAVEGAQPDLDPSVLARLSPRGVVLGVIDLGRADPESSEEVADRIRRALEFVEPEKLSVSPDCGMKYLPRDLARAKLRALVEGAATVRAELT